MYTTLTLDAKMEIPVQKTGLDFIVSFRPSVAWVVTPFFVEM